MITKLKARLNNAKSHPLPDTKDGGSDDENNDNQPSLTAALSATLTNPKRLIGQQEMVHAILLGIQGTNKRLYILNDKKDQNEIDLLKLSPDELQKKCKEYLKIECPSCGSDNTEPHKFSNFDFEIYASKIFESLRIHFGIQQTNDSNEYLYKLCGIGAPSKDKKKINLELFTSFWKTLITNSKSGQLFYKTKDSLFIIKSMSKKECNFLRNHLDSYYKYMMENKDSLICQFLGLYKVNIQFQKAVYVLIQKSVLYSYPQKLKMNKLYDLKGSTFGREATRWKIEMPEDDMVKISDSIRNKDVDDMVDKINDIDYNKPSEDHLTNHFDEQFSPSFYVPEIHEATSMKSYKSQNNDDNDNNDDIKDDENGDNNDKTQSSQSPQSLGAIFKRSKILKDLDFLKDKQAIVIGKKRKKLWLEQLEKDTKFLCTLKVMDYSLLLGMHYKSKKDDNDNDEKDNNDSKDRWKQGNLFRYEKGGMSYNDDSDQQTIDENLVSDDGLEISWSDEMGLRAQLENCIYFGGIIDILQPYNARKKVETFIMGFKTDSTKISSVDPELYSKRLINFMKDAVH